MQGVRRILWVLVGVALLLYGGYWWHARQNSASGANLPSPNATDQSVLPATVLQNPKPAPGFTLTNQSGKSVSLKQFRGKVVVLAFVDSQCTTVCPLTTVSMVNAKRALGPKAASQIQLLGIDANPTATALSDVQAYTKAHGMTGQWDFLTAPLPHLKSVWKAYGVSVAIVNGAIDHTPALFVIDPQGNERTVFMTQLAYATVGQQTDLLAKAVARLLPHPTPEAKSLVSQPLPPAPHLNPNAPVHLPLADSPKSGTITVGDGHAQLLVFFNSWLDQFGSVSHELQALNQYATAAKSKGLPPLVAVDVAPTEPSPKDLPALMQHTGHLNYPVAIDSTGALADHLNVQDLTWYVVIGSNGKILWSYDGSNNWLKPSQLVQKVQAALSKSGQ